MQLPFVGGAYTGISTNLNAQTCINLFPLVDKNDAKQVVSLVGTPGLDLFSEPESGTGLCLRALYSCKGSMYAVINARVYKINSIGAYTLLGAITTNAGFVSLADNGLEILIADGTTSGHIITISTGVLSDISDTDYPALESVTFQDGYFVGIEKDTGKFWISGLYSGTSWDALEFATAEGRPDNGVAIISNTHDLWIFGETSTEIYYNSGNADFPFTRIPGALIDSGSIAKASPVKIRGQLYWLSDKKQVCRNNGYQQEIISSPSLDHQIETYSVISDAVGFTYSIEGHHFYVIAFPTAEKTWVFDTSTGFWHEWQSYLSDINPWGRHRASCAAQLGNYWFVGDYSTGAIYKLSMTTYTDNAHAIRRQRAAQVISKERVNVIFHQLEIEFEAGVGLDAGVQGEDPQAMLDWSDDGGHTWSNQHWTSIGKIGEYTRRAIWRRLGKSRNRIFRVTCSDPVKTVILGAFANIEECKY